MDKLFVNDDTPLNADNLNRLVAVEEQSFTETQKQQARTNIGAEPAFMQLPLSKFPTSATANRILKVATANGTPVYSQVALTTDVTGTLLIANGGTGVSTVAGQSATQVKVFASPRSTTAGAPSFQALTAADVGAQAALVSGSNIKTINGNSLLSSGNITAADMGAQAALVSGSNIKTINGNSLLGSGNITAADVGAQAALVSGSNIKTINGNSLLGSGNIQISGSTGGQGIPAGGIAGQVLTKIDSSDYNTQWSNPSGGGGQETQRKYMHNISVYQTNDAIPKIKMISFILILNYEAPVGSFGTLMQALTESLEPLIISHQEGYITLPANGVGFFDAPTQVQLTGIRFSYDSLAAGYLAAVGYPTYDFSTQNSIMELPINYTQQLQIRDAVMTI